ncbi:hypothetical protein [Streptomyces sp. NPDC017964]
MAALQESVQKAKASRGDWQEGAREEVDQAQRLIDLVLHPIG